MKFYILDRDVSPTPIFYNNVGEVVNHLETALKRKFKTNRRAFMQNLTELGHGYDDPTGEAFANAMSQHYEMGVFKNQRCVRCNIHEVARYANYREEMGD